jgi:cytochrome P450
MMLHPEIQHRAQQEVDTFIARANRLPRIEDRSSLPFLEAILREVLRWSPPTPVGVFHASSADDIFEGYFIPAKTTVIANIWAMMHDESVYPDPFKFDPGRFLEDNGRTPEPDPKAVAFGFGR